MAKKTPVSANRLFFILRNKRIVFVISRETLCRIRFIISISLIIKYLINSKMKVLLFLFSHNLMTTLICFFIFPVISEYVPNDICINHRFDIYILY